MSDISKDIVITIGKLTSLVEYPIRTLVKDADRLGADLKQNRLETNQVRKFLDAIKQHPKIMEAYSSCTADVENVGHKFGTDLPDADKKALIAFLATL